MGGGIAAGQSQCARRPQLGLLKLPPCKRPALTPYRLTRLLWHAVASASYGQSASVSMPLWITQRNTLRKSPPAHKHSAKLAVRVACMPETGSGLGMRSGLGCLEGWDELRAGGRPVGAIELSGSSPHRRSRSRTGHSSQSPARSAWCAGRCSCKAGRECKNKRRGMSAFAGIRTVCARCRTLASAGVPTHRLLAASAPWRCKRAFNPVAACLPACLSAQ